MTDTLTQIDLPGQAHVADGPIDHTAMYAMHFAIRRDLDDLVAAAGATPADDGATWAGLHSYWRFLARLLHHHHGAEDDHYWPALAVAVEERGTPEDRATIAAMDQEHTRIGSALQESERSFARMIARRDPTSAAELAGHLGELRRLVTSHMTHEEAETLPLVSRVMRRDEYARVEAAIGRSYPIRLVPAMGPWVVHGLPEETQRALLEKAGAPQRLLLRLGRGRFQRQRQRAFHHLDPGGMQAGSAESRDVHP